MEYIRISETNIFGHGICLIGEEMVFDYISVGGKLKDRNTFYEK